VNNPECIKTQEIISAASDGAKLPAENVRLAKEHCSTCASCISFVKGLTSIRNLPGPQPPEEVIAAAIAAIREIAASASVAEERSTAENVNGWPPAKDVSDGPTTKNIGEGLASKIRRALHGRNALAWLGAAASIVIFTAAGTIAGVNYLLQMPTPATESMVTPQADTISEQPIAPLADGEIMQAQPERAATPVADRRFIVLGGFVYEVDDRRQQPPEGEPTASVISDLGTGQASPRDVHVSREDNAVAFVVAEDGAYEARLVTRTLNRDIYALRSSPIDLFGMWPTLPPEFAVPESPDGSPVFERAGRDDLGVRIFVPEGRTPAEGFAIAPNPPGDDLVADFQSWTWWAPFGLPD